MQITANMVKELREKTGIGMMECKKALVEANGDMDAAINLLRIWGAKVAQSKVGRKTSEGTVSSYIHAGGKIGVLIEVACESDFVADTNDFKELVHDLGMQIAAANPRWLAREDVPREVLRNEKNICLGQIDGNTTLSMAERIIEGKIEKFFSENVLIDQPFIKEPKRKIKDIIADKIAKLGENIQIKRFSRFELGWDESDGMS